MISKLIVYIDVNMNERNYHQAIKILCKYFKCWYMYHTFIINICASGCQIVLKLARGWEYNLNVLIKVLHLLIKFLNLETQRHIVIVDLYTSTYSIVYRLLHVVIP